MGDKTQLVTLAFACRYHPRTVFAGVAAATVLLQIIAVTIGGVLSRFLPQHWLLIVSGVAFLGFGAWTLWEGLPHEEDASLAEAGGRRGRHGIFLTVATTFFASELADKSTIAGAALASQQPSLFQVWLGATAGMLVADGLAILLGAVAGRQLPRTAIHYASAAVFLVTGVVTLGGLLLS